MRGRLIVATALLAVWGRAALGAKANLTMTLVDVIGDPPITANPEDEITVRTIVQNEPGGDPAPTTFRVGIYLSPDDTIDPTDPATDDIFLDFWTASALGAGVNEQKDTVVTLPADIGGAYFIGAYADYQEAVPEGGAEGDNGLADMDGITILGPAPDLVITSFNAPNVSVEPGGTITVEITVKNEGAAAAAEFTVGIYLSADTTIDPTDPTDILLDTWVVTDGLDSGAELSLTPPREVNITGNTDVGVYYLGAYADYEQVVNESDRTNNARADTDGIGVGVAAPSPPVTPFGGGCSSGGGAAAFLSLALFFAWRRRVSC